MIKWIPFNSDSLPPNDKVVIVCGCCEMVAKPHRYYDFAIHINGRLLSISDSEEEVEDVTHWAYADQIGLPDSIPLYERWARSPVENTGSYEDDCKRYTHIRIFGDEEHWNIDAADDSGNYSDCCWTHYDGVPLTKDKAQEVAHEFAKEIGRPDLIDIRFP